MKQFLLILFLATNICVAQKKIAIVITGYDGIADSIMVSNVNFRDTSYYIVDERAMTVNKKDSIYYDLYSEINPWEKSEYEICEFYFCTDFWGTSCWLNLFEVVFHITRKKLISLGKM